MESNISGKRREQIEFTKKVGVFEGQVICINPSEEEFKDLLGIELKEESKATEYLGDSRDGNSTLRINVWIGWTNQKERFVHPVSFFLEDKERTNKEGTKKQYINSIGVCSWSDDPNSLPAWFTKREYRVAYVGEEELYTFLRTWLGNLDYRDAETILQLDWKKLMKGNVKELRDQIDGEYSTNVVALATISTRENKEGEVKEYQSIYNKAFLPPYSLRYFRLVDYTDETVLSKLRSKKVSDLKIHEKFVVTVTDPEYGCKDFYVMKELCDYNPDDNIAASDTTMSEASPSY